MTGTKLTKRTDRVFKVVMERPIEGLGRVLTSVFAEGEAMVVYKPGEITKAPEWLAKQGNHITVFSSLEAARDYMIRFTPNPAAQLWECEAWDRTRRGSFCSITCLSRKNYEPYRKHNQKSQWPEGTIMVKGLKLVKRIGVS